mgnify:FL=1
MRMTRNIFEKLCNDYAYLYVIKLYNETEEFYKIGITSKETIVARFNSIPYEYDIISLYKHKDSSFIMDLESKLLSLESKYKPNTYFQGESECVADIVQVVEFLKTLNWIKGLTEHFIEEARDNKQILKQKLGTSNFSEICKIYIEALETNDREQIKFIEDFNTILKDARLTFKNNVIEHIKASAMKQSVLEKRIEVQNKTNIHLDSILMKLNLQKSQFYSLKDIKAKLTSIYEEMGINKKAKASDIETLYKTHKTVKSGINGYLIL